MEHRHSVECKVKRKFVLAGLLAFAASSVSATTIDFEGLSGSAGTISGAAFAGPSGAIIWDFGGSFAHSGVKTLGGDFPDTFNASILVSFATGVSGLSFWSSGDDANGLEALIDGYVGGVLSATVNLLGDGNAFSTDFQDLSAFNNVTSIFIHDVTDPAGLVYDDFTFTPSAVPVPAAGLLLAGAMVGLGALSRRRRQA